MPQNQLNGSEELQLGGQIDSLSCNTAVFTGLFGFMNNVHHSHEIHGKDLSFWAHYSCTVWYILLFCF